VTLAEIVDGRALAALLGASILFSGVHCLHGDFFLNSTFEAPRLLRAPVLPTMANGDEHATELSGTVGSFREGSSEKAGERVLAFDVKRITALQSSRF
jgi:hypothetical protein